MTEAATETDDAADPDLEAVTEAAGGAIETDLAIDPDLGVATDTADETDTKHIATNTHTLSPHYEQFLANLENLQQTPGSCLLLVPNNQFFSPLPPFIFSLYNFSFTLSRTEKT